MDDERWGIAHRRYLTLDDYRDLFWSHCEEPWVVLARLRAFPEGLSRDEVLSRQASAGQRFPLEGHGEHLGCYVKRPGWTDEHPLWIPWPEVCPGEIVLLRAGDAVLADIRIISTTNGEPVVTRGVKLPSGMLMGTLGSRQKAALTEPQGTPFYQARNMLWAGDMILRGGCVGIAVHTRTLTVVYLTSQLGESLDLRTLPEKCLESEGLSALVGTASRLIQATKIVVDYKSLLGAHDDGGDDLVVREVLVGQELERIAPGDKEMLEVYQACARLSQSSLGLESMKRFNNGLISVENVEEEDGGAHKDAVGTALLRFALQGLKAREFWAWRSKGFKLFTSGASGGDLLASSLDGKSAVFRCSPTAALHMEWVTGATDHNNNNNRRGVPLSKMLVSQCNHLYTRGLSPYIIASVQDWDGSSVPSRARFLALLGVRRRRAAGVDSDEDIGKAVRRLKSRANLKFVFRVASAEELPQCLAVAQRLRIWEPEFEPVVWGSSLADQALQGDNLEAALEAADVLVMPKLEVEQEEKFRAPIPPAVAVLAPADPDAPPPDLPDVPFVSLRVDLSLPFYAGCIPVATCEAEDAWLWKFRGLDMDDRYPLAIGDRLLKASAGVLAMHVGSLAHAIWFVSPRDNAINLFFDYLMLTVCPSSSLPTGVQSNARVVLLHDSFNHFAKQLLRLRAGQSALHQWDVKPSVGDPVAHEQQGNKCAIV